jgi:NAD(P)-dependent dehydrogenase (short-subunit alcohol dehydrogenase family)
MGVSREQGSVIVVGGAGNIGSAVVARYLEAGIGVAMIDKEPSKTPPQPAQGVQFHQVLADVTRTEDLVRARSELDRLEWPAAHIVSMAGGALDPEFESLIDTDAQTIRHSIELNLTSHILLIREFLPMLGFDSVGRSPATTDRSITLVSSINALRDYGLPAYSAAKAGLIGLVHAMASELGTHGIRINAVAPGTVRGPASRSQPKDYDALRRNTALGRLAGPDDVADAILAMSHSMTAVTGQYLVVDCGQTVTPPAWRLPEGGR